MNTENQPRSSLKVLLEGGLKTVAVVYGLPIPTLNQSWQCYIPWAVTETETKTTTKNCYSISSFYDFMVWTYTPKGVVFTFPTAAYLGPALQLSVNMKGVCGAWVPVL